MASVDNRAVQMTFDNAAFERNVHMTMLSLEQLKRSLDMTNAKNSFAEINRASSGFHLNGITNAIESVSSKFLAMRAVAFSVISNITNRAVDMGINLAKSLSIAPLMQGFQEYETNMNSIQTILANTSAQGTTLTDVTAALDELNHYADQTIYNFSEMARNIGTFTAAGVDLDTATGAIKGIANLAAVSGSNAQQAASGMYQLSQAIATGTVRLIDWNSVQNAGMGGEVFQKALFETGKALGTIKDTPIDTTFEQWTAAGNNFRGSLEEGWLTAEVLTNTLAGFTGDLSEAQLLSMGYTKEQAAEILRMGQVAQDAATKVKTFTQLLGTIKEAIGSGWARSFQIIIGDFEEAKQLFTSINDVIGGIIGRSADSRNELLSSWKALGGRTKLIEGIKAAFEGFNGILKPIKLAFREIFPKKTAADLFWLTDKFKELMERIKIGGSTFVQFKRIFRGVFAAIEIGWHVIKEVIDLFGDLWQAVKPEGNFLKTLGNFGDLITSWNETLIAGHELEKFFNRMSYFIKNPKEGLEALKNLLGDLKDKFVNAFNGGEIPGAGVINGILDRLQTRLDTLKEYGLDIGGAWDSLQDFFSGITDVLEEAWVSIRDWFKNLGNRLATATSPEDYDAALDTVNAGLLGGIGLLLIKFFQDGIKLDFTGGLLDGVKETLDTLTTTLQDMQTKLKAEALQSIAIAIGVLAAALLVLSFIDSEDLAKALSAMAIGFGQLIAAFVALNGISAGPSAKFGLAALSGGLIMLATAMLILAVAMKIMSTMDWEEMGKGVAGVTALLGLMVGVVKLLAGSSGQFITAGLGMIAIATALNILALALKLMATMSWEELGKGLAGVAGGLAAITASMILLPDNMVNKGLGILTVAVALNILALALKSMAEMTWEEMGRGLAGVAGGLVLMVGAMALLGQAKGVFRNAAGILVLSVALNIMALALKSISDLSWEELARGLAGAAGALLLLAGAAYIMNGAVSGAFAIVIMAGALRILSGVLVSLSNLSWLELAKGLAAIAGVFVVIGLAALALAPALGPLLGLAAAMFLIGVGMAAFGAGVNVLARGIIMLLKVGDGVVDLIMNILDAVLSEVPKIATSLAKGLLGFVQTFLDGLPAIIESLVIVIDAILQAVIDMIPKIVEVTIAVIDALLKVIVEKTPDVVAAGFSVLIAFLTGIRDNIGEIVTLVAEIIVNFLDALGEKIPEIIDAVFDFVVDVVEGVVAKLVDIGSYLVDRGKELLGGLITGIGEKAVELMNWFLGLPGAIIGWIGETLMTLKDRGIELISGFLTGIAEKAGDVTLWFLGLPAKFVGYFLGAVGWLKDAGKDIINGLWEGLKDIWEYVENWFLGKVNWVKDQWNKITNFNPLGGVNLDDAITEIEEKKKAQESESTTTNKPNSLANSLDRDKRTETAATNFGGRVTSALESSLLLASDLMQNMNEFNPTITPVLDLSSIQKDAKTLDTFFGDSPIDTALAFNQARGISFDAEALRLAQDRIDEPQVPTELKFEQHNYSPKALNTNEIYRNTRSQVAQAKEELKIP